MSVVSAPILIVTAPHPLTSEQREQVRNNVANQITAGTGVIVVDPGFTVLLIGGAGPIADLVRGEAQQDKAPGLILQELKKLRADLAEQQEYRTTAALSWLVRA